jgi:hypothetical protein
LIDNNFFNVPKIELFGRKQKKNWFSLGNEKNKFDSNEKGISEDSEEFQLQKKNQDCLTKFSNYKEVSKFIQIDGKIIESKKIKNFKKKRKIETKMQTTLTQFVSVQKEKIQNLVSENDNSDETKNFDLVD